MEGRERMERNGDREEVAMTAIPLGWWEGLLSLTRGA